MESLPLGRLAESAAPTERRSGSAAPVHPFRQRRASDPVVRARLKLQQRASGNLRRHMVRSIARAVVLVTADLGAFALTRGVLRAVRDYEVLGPAVADQMSALFPRGILSGLQFAVALIVALAVTGNYGKGDQRHDGRRLFVAAALATALPLWLTLWTRGLEAVLLQYGLTTVLIWLALIAERFPIDRIVARLFPESRRAPTVFVGSREDCAVAMAAPGFHAGADYRIVGFVDTHHPPDPDALGSITTFSDVLQDSGAETIVVCGYLHDGTFHDVVDASIAAGTQILSVPRAIKVAGVAPTMVWREGQPLIELSRPALKSSQMFLKRMLDLTCSVLGLVVTAPLWLVIWLAVKLESPGPAIFGHERLGLNGQSFKCYKFRSMHADADERLRSDALLYRAYVTNHYKLPEHIDPRLTRVGRFLRKTSLDELPQLLNVIIGNMSLVGPRPIVFEEIDEYGHGAPAFLSLKPGITGAWQIHGRSQVGYPQRADIELNYVRNWSLARDVWILAKTLPIVLIQRGAH